MEVCSLGGGDGNTAKAVNLLRHAGLDPASSKSILLSANGFYWIPFSKGMTGSVKGGAYGRKTL